MAVSLTHFAGDEPNVNVGEGAHDPLRHRFAEAATETASGARRERS